MEVNDRPNGMEVAGAKHDQGFLWLINLRSQWLFTGIGSFFNELERRKTLLKLMFIF